MLEGSHEDVLNFIESKIYQPGKERIQLLRRMLSATIVPRDRELVNPRIVFAVENRLAALAPRHHHLLAVGQIRRLHVQRHRIRLLLDYLLEHPETGFLHRLLQLPNLPKVILDDRRATTTQGPVKHPGHIRQVHRNMVPRPKIHGNGETLDPVHH